MSDCVRETACTNYIHREICMYRQDFLNIYNAVFNTSVTIDYPSKNGIAFKKITDFDLISISEISCRYFKKEILTRTGISEWCEPIKKEK